MPSSAILTNCTSSKSFDPAPRQMARTMECSDIRGLSREWSTRRLDAERVPVRDLYQGRSFKIAQRAADWAGSSLYTVSAGYGVLKADDRIPPYSITISGESEDNILIKAGGAKAAAWWRELEPLKSIVADLADFAVVMIALPAEYLLMIEEEICGLKRSMSGELLIFACPGVANRLRPNVAESVLPYGKSLECADSPVRGTGTDAAQRRLLHFTTHLAPQLAPSFSHADAKQAVETFAKTLLQPTRKPGRAVSDQEVVELISSLASRGVTSRTAALRHLRSVEGVACSQERFQSLFRSVQ